MRLGPGSGAEGVCVTELSRPRPLCLMVPTWVFALGAGLALGSSHLPTGEHLWTLLSPAPPHLLPVRTPRFLGTCRSIHSCPLHILLCLWATWFDSSDDGHSDCFHGVAVANDPPWTRGASVLSQGCLGLLGYIPRSGGDGSEDCPLWLPRVLT